MSQNIKLICLINEIVNKEVPAIFGKFRSQDDCNVTVHDFQALFEKHYQAVYKQVYFLTLDKSVSEDIAQETFIKLYNSCPISLKNPGAWLNKVATNLSYNYLNGETRRREKESSHEKLFLVKSENSEDTVIKKEEVHIVREILKDMSGKERMTLMLRFSGYSYEEIAETMCIPKASVGKTLSRAQEKFKEAYLQREGSAT